MLGRDKVWRSPGPAILRHMRPALPDCNPRFPSIGFTFVFATISPPSIRPVPQSKGRTMATAMKLSVPKPVNLPSMKKVRPRPDALTRNQRRSALFPVTNGGTRPRPEDDPRSRATVFTIAGALRERSQRAAGSEQRPGGLDRQETRRRQGRDKRATGADHRRGEASAPSRRRLVGVGRARAPNPGRHARRRRRGSIRRPPARGPTHQPTDHDQPRAPLLARRATSSSETKPCPGSGASEGWTRAITQPWGDQGRRTHERPGRRVRGQERRRTRATTGTTAGTTRAGTRTSAAAAAGTIGPGPPPRSPRDHHRDGWGRERGSYGHHDRRRRRRRRGRRGGRFPRPRGSGGSRDRPYYDEPNPFSDDDDDYDYPPPPPRGGGGGGGGGGGADGHRDDRVGHGDDRVGHRDGPPRGYRDDRRGPDRGGFDGDRGFRRRRISGLDRADHRRSSHGADDGRRHSRESRDDAPAEEDERRTSTSRPRGR